MDQPTEKSQPGSPGGHPDYVGQSAGRNGLTRPHTAFEKQESGGEAGRYSGNWETVAGVVSSCPTGGAQNGGHDRNQCHQKCASFYESSKHRFLREYCFASDATEGQSSFAGSTGHPEATDHTNEVLALANDSDPGVKLAARKALINLASEDNLPALFPLLLSASNPEEISATQA